MKSLIGMTLASMLLQSVCSLPVDLPRQPSIRQAQDRDGSAPVPVVVSGDLSQHGVDFDEPLTPVPGSDDLSEGVIQRNAVSKRYVTQSSANNHLRPLKRRQMEYPQGSPFVAEPENIDQPTVESDSDSEKRSAQAPEDSAPPVAPFDAAPPLPPLLQLPPRPLENRPPQSLPAVEAAPSPDDKPAEPESNEEPEPDTTGEEEESLQQQQDQEQEQGQEQPQPQPQEEAPQEGAAQEGAAQEGAPQEGAAQEGAPQEGAPQEAAPQEAAPQEAAPQEAAPQEAAPQEQSPQEEAPQEQPPQQPERRSANLSEE